MGTGASVMRNGAILTGSKSVQEVKSTRVGDGWDRSAPVFQTGISRCLLDIFTWMFKPNVSKTQLLIFSLTFPLPPDPPTAISAALQVFLHPSIFPVAQDKNFNITLDFLLPYTTSSPFGFFSFKKCIWNPTTSHYSF